MDNGIYSFLGKNLYKLNSSPTEVSSIVNPASIDSGIQTGFIEVQSGGLKQGKTKFDNTETGFILGIDGTVAKFYLGNTTGYINWDGTTLTIVGGLSVDSLDIPDTTTANSFHVDVDGNTWWGAATLGASVASVTKAGLGTFSNIVITGGSVSGASIASIPNSTATDISLLGASYDLVFSVTDADTIAWASGTIVLSNGRTFSISGGNTGNMTALTYIYLDPAVSSTVLQTTTTYSTANGANKKLIGTAQNHTVTASFIPFEGGQPLIDGANIGALSIVAGNIAATTITAGKMNVSTLSSIVADIGTITAGSISVVNGGNTIGFTPAGANAIFSGTTGSPEFKVTPAGAVTATSIFISGATSTFNSSLVTNVQNRAETLWTKDYAFVGFKTDGLTVVGGTITRNFLSTSFVVNGAANVDVYLHSGVLGTTIDGGNMLFNTGDWEFSCHCEYSSSANQDSFLGLFNTGGIPTQNATDTANHIGFYLEDGTMYASNANGTTQTRTSFAVTLTNMNHFRFVYDVGVDIKFYLNDTLMVTHTTNMPTTGTVPSLFLLLNGASDGVADMTIKNNYLITLDV